MLMKFSEKLLVLPAHWGRCLAKRGGRGKRVASQLNIVPVSSNFPVPWGTTQISCGTRTKHRYNLSDGKRKLRTLASMVPSTYLLKLLFLTRYINCSSSLLACPLGKVPSEARRKGAVNREKFLPLFYKKLTWILEYF